MAMHLVMCSDARYATIVLTMKPITLRNLPDEVARAIRKKAEKEGMSLNKAVIGLLEQSIGGPGQRGKGPRRDLSPLAGTWKKEEADEFDKFLAELRQIDPEMWQ